MCCDQTIVLPTIQEMAQSSNHQHRLTSLFALKVGLRVCVCAYVRVCVCACVRVRVRVQCSHCIRLYRCVRLQALVQHLSPEVTGSKLVPIVVSLAQDNIPNVRINVAKTLKAVLEHLGHSRFGCTERSRG